MTQYESSKSLYEKTYKRESAFFSKIDEKDLLRTFALFSTNGLAVEESKVFDYRTVERGAALYLQVSLFNHSCDPDLVFFTGDTAQMTVKTLKDVGDKNFEDLTISYCQFHPPAVCTTAEFRKPLLKGRFSFNCRCVLCRDKKADLLKLHGVNIDCSRCGEPMIIKKEQRDIPEKRNRAKCLNCKQYYKIPVNQFLATTQFWEMYLKDSPDKFPTALLPRIAEILHPLKSQKLMELRFMSGNLIEGEKILDMYEHYGVKAPSYPILCAQLGRIYEKAEEFDKAKQLYERGLKLWNNIYTPQHRCSKTLNFIIRKRLPEAIAAAKKRVEEENERKRMIQELEEREKQENEAEEEDEDNQEYQAELPDVSAKPPLGFPSGIPDDSFNRKNYLPGTHLRPSDTDTDSDDDFKRRPFALPNKSQAQKPSSAFTNSSHSKSDSGSDSDKSADDTTVTSANDGGLKQNRRFKRRPQKGSRSKQSEVAEITVEDEIAKRKAAAERMDAVKEAQNKTFEWPAEMEDSDVSI